jgi:hypothetical protein
MVIAGAVAFLVVGLNESVFFAVVDHDLHRPPEFIGVLASGPQTVSIATGALLVSAVDYRLLLLAVTTGMLGAAAYLWQGRTLTLPAAVPEGVPG